MKETRIDRNVVDNIIDLRQFDRDSVMIKMVLFYFAWKHQNNNLFETETLDVDEFCRVMSLQRENVIAKHSEPKHLATFTKYKLEQRLKEVADSPDDLHLRLFDSNIENALYRLYKENITYTGQTRYYKSDNGDTNVVYPLERIIFLSSLQARHITTKNGRRKIVYDYQLNDSFKKNLSLYFSNINLNHFIQLRKSGSEDLYVYLKNLRDTLLANNMNGTNTVQFEYLCDIANINTQNPPDRKKILIRKFKMLSEKLDFPVVLEFKVESGHRWAYSPVIIFPITDIGDERQAKVEQRKQILLQNFMRAIVEAINAKYPNYKAKSADFQLDVLLYCQKDIDQTEKKEAFRQAQLKSFINPDPVYMRQANIDSIPKRLLKVASQEDILDVITKTFRDK